MTKDEFRLWLADCSSAYAMTMPGLLMPIKLSNVDWWLERSFKDPTYKPTVQFGEDGYGDVVYIGLPMGKGIEVTP